MLKLIAFFLGVAIGLAGGIYWSAHNPTQANTVAAAEERKFIELQLQASQAIKQKLDQLANKQQATGGGPGSGFLSAHSAPVVTPGEINSVRDQQDQQIQQLQERLKQLPK